MEAHGTGLPVPFPDKRGGKVIRWLVRLNRVVQAQQSLAYYQVQGDKRRLTLRAPGAGKVTSITAKVRVRGHHVA